MAVTIQQIAEQAGVSRGTVDRALNHRGRINPEVAERICRLADEMGYVQKERKHSRTAKDERLKIGVVTQLARSSFMQEVNRGIEKAAVELKEKGIQLILKEGLSVDEEEQLQAIEELEQEGIRGLAVMPVDSEAVREKLNALIEEKNIPVVTFNSDIVGTRRTKLLEDKGVVRDNSYQEIAEGIVVYPKEYFSPYDYGNCVLEKTEHSICVHHFFVSWLPWQERIKKKLKRILVGIIGKRKMVELRNKLRHQNEVE